MEPSNPLLEELARFRKQGVTLINNLEWTKSLKNIFVFIEHYVPKHLFDLRLASAQQLELFEAVQRGDSYLIIRAPRKGGKTICVAIIAVWLTLVDLRYRVFILSGSQNQAEWLYDYCKQILWPSGPQGAATRKFFSQFLLSEPMKTRLLYKAGGWIRYSAASSKQVNAPTADALIMDEYVLIPTGIKEEAWPMVRGSEKIMRILLSTATPGKEGTDSFLDILDESQDLGFKKFEWEAKDCPFLQTEVAKKDTEIARHFISEDMFRTQYIGLLPRGAGRIFPKTLIRQAFVAPDPDRPGFLLPHGTDLEGVPYDLENLEFKGESKGSFDWGYDHDTAMLEAYRGLNQKIVLMKLVIENNTSATDWANRAYKDWEAYNVFEWHCDAAGAFENREVQDRGLRVIRRPFGSKTEGKEFIIGITYYWLEHNAVIIPDTPEFQPLKKQLLAYRRGADGKPVKRFDNAVDSFILLLGAWDPIYYEESRNPPLPSMPTERDLNSLANDWQSYRSEKDGWMPTAWESRREELTRLPSEMTRNGRSRTRLTRPSEMTRNGRRTRSA